MANVLEKFYNKFVGVDTRSNKLLQDPGSFRRGSKNMRYNFQDEIQNRNGLQKKDASEGTFVDIFEYKYRNPETGDINTQILAVGIDGALYRKKNYWLNFVTVGAATSVSCFYDETLNLFKMTLTGVGSVTFSKTVPLKDNPTTTASLVGKLNALAGVSAQILDDDGNAVTSSSKLAYLLDCVIDDTNFEDNAVYYWEIVPFADDANGMAAFPVTFGQYTSPNYEGISSINLNNCIYMTDGGFPMKYDGKCVYRAGVPSARQYYDGYSVIEMAGVAFSFVTSSTSVPVGLPTGTYGWKFRYCFKDYYGASYYGQLTEFATLGLISANFQGAKLQNVGLPYGHDFPVFACAVKSTSASVTIGGTGADGSVNFTIDTMLTGNLNCTTVTLQAGVKVYLNGYTLKATGLVTIGAGATITDAIASRTLTQTTFNVWSHNFVAGQSLVLKTSNISGVWTTSYFAGYCYATIISTTSSTVTITNPVASTVNIAGSEVLNAYWTPRKDYYESAAYWTPPYGFSIELFRTMVDQATDPITQGPMYLVGHSAVGYDDTYQASIIDDRADQYVTILFDDLEPGEEIPRGCKYLTQVQNQLVQAGLPLNYDLNTIYYPSTSVSGANSIYNDQLIYTTALFCDSQSVYWADALTPEGFSQDGIHEISVDTKFADRVKGIGPNKDVLFAFKDRSSAVIAGNFANNDVSLEVLEVDAGCVSHKTIEDVRGHIMWLDKINGFYSCVAGRLPENIGFPIQDYQKINPDKLDYSLATAANFRKESLYICSVGTTTFVFDYADNGSLKRNCWYIWETPQISTILATSDDKLLTRDTTNTWKIKTTNTVYDFTDDVDAIETKLLTAWNQQGMPTIDKHYIALWINSIQGDFTLTITQYGNFLDELIGTQSDVVFIPQTSNKKFVKTPVKACIPKLSSISFGFEHAEKNKWMRIQGYEIQLSADFTIGEPKR